MTCVPERVYHSVNVPYDYHSPLCLVFSSSLVNMPLWVPKVAGIRKVRPFQSLEMDIFPEIWPVCTGVLAERRLRHNWFCSPSDLLDNEYLLSDKPDRTFPGAAMAHSINPKTRPHHQA